MKKALALLVVLGFVFMVSAPALAAKPEPVEKIGVIEIQKADVAKKEKYDTILLKVGEESFKLIPGKTPKDKKEFKKLNEMGGKEVTVKGNLMPANPPKYPMAAILVASFEEKAAATPAPTTPAPAEAPKVETPAPTTPAPAEAPKVETPAPTTPAPAETPAPTGK